MAMAEQSVYRPAGIPGTESDDGAAEQLGRQGFEQSDSACKQRTDRAEGIAVHHQRSWCDVWQVERLAVLDNNAQPQRAERVCPGDICRRRKKRSRPFSLF